LVVGLQVAKMMGFGLGVLSHLPTLLNAMLNIGFWHSFVYSKSIQLHSEPRSH